MAPTTLPNSNSGKALTISHTTFTNWEVLKFRNLFHHFPIHLFSPRLAVSTSPNGRSVFQIEGTGKTGVPRGISRVFSRGVWPIREKIRARSAELAQAGGPVRRLLTAAGPGDANDENPTDGTGKHRPRLGGVLNHRVTESTERRDSNDARSGYGKLIPAPRRPISVSSVPLWFEDHWRGQRPRWAIRFTNS